MLRRTCLALSTATALAFPSGATAAEPDAITLTVDFGREAVTVPPRTGFLGGLRDALPDETVRPLHPTLFRIGHQFVGRIAGGLTAAVDRVHALGARYKLVMSDLVKSDHEDGARYEADVRRLVGQVGPERAKRILWEPVNEPDISHKPITKYYALYAHAFKALRETNPALEICGPGFAFPSHDKYKAFLDFCRDGGLECNDLAWHYTGWDPDAPQQQKWDLGRLPELARAYPAQKIREIHCDEWGAGPDKPSRESPGRLHPGRAVIWFHYLEDVYKVDRACRANWGHEDDLLGGIVNAKGETHPVYHVYRLYAGLRQVAKVPSEGSDRWTACLAGKGPDRREVLLGSIAKAPRPVTLVLKGLGASAVRLEVRRFPGADLDAVTTEGSLPLLEEQKGFSTSREGGALRVAFDPLEENQAVHIRVLPK